MDPGKGIKFLVIGALTIVFLLQIYKSYANWMNPEVARIFSEELIGTDTPHPDLSICLFNLTTNETEEYLKSRTPVQIFEELPPIYSVVPYYKPQGLKDSLLSEEFYQTNGPGNITKEDLVQITWAPTFPTGINICYTVSSPTKYLKLGWEHMITFVLVPSSEYMVYFGLNFAGYYSNVFSSSYLFKFKTKSSKSVDGKKFNDVHNIKVLRHQQLDRPSQRSPCIDEVRETMHQCLKRYFAQKMGCRLPWYHQSPNPDLPVCTRIQDTLLYLNLTAKIRPMDRHDLVTELDCDMPCSYYEYQMEIHHEKMVDCEGNCQQTHTLILPDGNVYVDKEVLLYDGNNFIADSGGYLGLLLGASVITLYEWLEKVARKGWRRYFERKNGDLSGARKMDTK